mgnify:CR=1 FL=1
MHAPVVLASDTLIDASAVDYLILILYFAVVLTIGFTARARVSESLDFFLSGRSLPAWVTGLAFISANLGAVEIMGMSANGAQIGLPTVHYFWVGAIPAMLFLGVVMMPFYYGSKVRSVPEFMLRRFGPGAHLVNSVSFALAQLLIAGVNLYLLGSIVHALLGWPLWVALIVAAVIVLSYITLGGLSAAIYNEVLQFFVIVASLLPLTILGLHRLGGWSGLEEKITAAAAQGAKALASADVSWSSAAAISLAWNACPLDHGLPLRDLAGDELAKLVRRAAPQLDLVAARLHSRREDARGHGLPDLGCELIEHRSRRAGGRQKAEGLMQREAVARTPVGRQPKSGAECAKQKRRHAQQHRKSHADCFCAASRTRGDKERGEKPGCEVRACFDEANGVQQECAAGKDEADD